MSRHSNLVLLTGKPPGWWRLNAGGLKPVLDIDFIRNLGWNNGTSLISSLLSCTRATPAAAYYTKADGTLTTFAANTLRYGTNGLLVEEARTNLQTRSQEIDDGTAWPLPGGRATISANAMAAPDGTVTADKIIEAAGGGSHGVQPVITGLAANTNYIYSFFAKAAERSIMATEMSGTVIGGAFKAAYFNLSGAGSVTDVGSGITCSIVALASSWYRCSIAFTSDSDGGDFNIFVGPTTVSGSFSYTGDGTSGIYLWGAQLEVGAFATSYIPTTTASVTRAADVVTYSGAVAIFTPAAGTFYTQVDGIPGTDAILFGDGATPSSFGVTSQSANVWKTLQVGVNFPATSGVSATVAAKIAAAYATTAHSISANGGAAGTGTASVAAVQVNSLYLGSNQGINEFLNTNIKRIAFWQSKLSDGALQTLTT
jgi:hypothetical protein